MADDKAPETQPALTHEAFFTSALTLPAKLRPLKAEDAPHHLYEVIFSNGVQAILKLQHFSNRSIKADIPLNTTCKRDVAAYQLDYKLLHWHVVPPTTLTIWKHKVASVQARVNGVHADDIVKDVWKGGLKYARLAAKVDIALLRKTVLLDLIINNQRRSMYDLLFDTMGDHVWAIDNSLTFGDCFEGYQNVFHQALFRNLLHMSQSERDTLAAITQQDLLPALARYLTPRDILQTYWRIQWMLSQENLGWEAITKSQIMPSRRAYFKRQMQTGERNKVLRDVSNMQKITIV